MFSEKYPKIDKQNDFKSEAPRLVNFLIKTRGKINISHFLNRKLPGKYSTSDRLRRELPEFGVAIHARFCKLGPTAARLRPLNKAEAP